MQQTSNGIGPIHCAHLLRTVDNKLLDLLRSLEPHEWDLPTTAGSWTVRDVAAHLLDTPLRKLSMVRDSCFVEPAEIHSPQDLVQLINRLNQQGVAVYRRLSPSLLIDMMQVACEQSATFHESLDPLAPAKFAVSWAGEETSLNWFDTARELTERWHHQQQIRLATNRPGIMTPGLYHPVLDCFLRALPHAFRNTTAPLGATVLIEITGDSGGKWFLQRGSSEWAFAPPSEANITSHVTIPQEIAWRLFTKGIARASAATQIHIQGDHKLGETIFDITAIVG